MTTRPSALQPWSTSAGLERRMGGAEQQAKSEISDVKVSLLEIRDARKRQQSVMLRSMLDDSSSA